MSSSFFFDCYNIVVKEAVKVQGTIICRDAFHQEMLEYALRKFNYGYAFYKIGQKGIGKNGEIRVTSFILFSVRPLVNELSVQMLCGRSAHKDQLLLDRVKQYAEENDITVIRLYALPESRLLEFYLKNGFIQTDIVLEKSGAVNAYEMKYIPVRMKYPEIYAL